MPKSIKRITKKLEPLNKSLPYGTIVQLARKHNLSKSLVFQIVSGNSESHINIYNEAAEIAINHNRALNEARELSKQLQ